MVEDESGSVVDDKTVKDLAAALVEQLRTFDGTEEAVVAQIGVLCHMLSDGDAGATAFAKRFFLEVEKLGDTRATAVVAKVLALPAGT